MQFQHLYALTVRQPWATLIALGYKRYEYRSWQCPLKPQTRFYLHSSAAKHDEEFAKLTRDEIRFLRARGIVDRHAMDYGFIIGLVEYLGDYLSFQSHADVGIDLVDDAGRRRHWGQHWWPIRSVEVFSTPVRACGATRFWAPIEGIKQAANVNYERRDVPGTTTAAVKELRRELEAAEERIRRATT